MGNQYFKKKALGEINGRWGQELGIMVIYFIIAIVGSVLVKESGLKNMVYTLITSILSMGYMRHVLKASYNTNEFDLEGLFYYFTTKDILALIGLNLVVGLLTILWSLLFIIPGIIMSLAYSQSIYLKIENRDMPIKETIRTSKEMMEGHKMDYFILNLSFIGWYILGAITVVGIIPVSVYVQFTMVEYYKELKKKQGIESDGGVNLSK